MITVEPAQVEIAWDEMTCNLKLNGPKVSEYPASKGKHLKINLLSYVKTMAWL